MFSDALKSERAPLVSYYGAIAGLQVTKLSRKSLKKNKLSCNIWIPNCPEYFKSLNINCHVMLENQIDQRNIKKNKLSRNVWIFNFPKI